jgi:hypothetical protein
MFTAGRTNLKTIAVNISAFIKKWVEMDASSTKSMLSADHKRLIAVAGYASQLGNSTKQAQDVVQRSRASEAAFRARGVFLTEEDVKAVIAHARAGFVSVYAQLQNVQQPEERQWRQLQMFLQVWTLFAVLGQRSEFYRHLLVSELQKTQDGSFMYDVSFRVFACWLLVRF